ncbi:MAG: RluA family pseudouridine synthase [Candidatus Omnitrophica bacterium]|nr:RluA family pseudouridine synthase [Candidatus Omnitrophota bacterium]
MDELTFTVTQEEAGIRVDKCIALRLGEEYSRTYVKYLMDNGFVSVNEKSVKPSYITHEGDEVFLELVPSPEDMDIEPEDIKLTILYEDEWVIVIDKPAGMVVHPGAGNKKGTMASALLYHCGKLPDAGDRARPGIVHRLDKGTSGVIVAAKNERALRSLSRQFQKRAVKKCYLVLVKGRVEIDNGVIEVPVARHSTDRKKMSVDHDSGKPARTVYHVLERFERFTLLRLELFTGRTHQIRVHMQHIGYPVIGDVKYGGDRRMPRQALHAELLGFTHPDTGEYMEFTSPMPEDMKEFLETSR